MSGNSQNETSDERKPRFLFVGEGPNDVGRVNDPGGALAGFLHAVLVGPSSPVSREELPFEVVQIRYWREIARIDMPRRFAQALRIKGDASHVVAAMLLAATMDGIDGVVIVLDCERRDATDRGMTIREGRDRYRQREPERTPLLCVIATPSRSQETWLLVDDDAVRQVLGPTAVFRFSGDPEERPASDELKKHIEQVAGEAAASVRIKLAYLARPGEIARRCRRCYPEFLHDVQSELGMHSESQ